jgi:polyferredoxin
VAANYAALLPVAAEPPYLLLGGLLAVGALSGSLVCGWACPFGLLQDGLARLPVRKVSLPDWAGHFRYVVLVGWVILLPMLLGYRGIPFDEQSLSICRLCPAGALEAGLPYSVRSVLGGGEWLMSWFKSALLVGFLVAALFIHRPWCRLVCPLGGALALFNRVSLFHLRFNAPQCAECNLCRSRCPMGVKVDVAVNVTGWTRCLECLKCGAIEAGFARPR